jgi:glycosyltransferase involved in cell wall biosynthesis
MIHNILFSLRCDFPSGGCIKVRDYYHHACNAVGFKTNVYLPQDAVWDESNPWWLDKYKIMTEHRPDLADVLFISGLGWDRFIPTEYKTNSPIPIIYLVQGLFKLNPEYPHYQHFNHKAIRICVSQVITEELEQRNISVNGPVFTISNCIDIKQLPEPLSFQNKDIELLIIGLKNPVQAEELSRRLSSFCCGKLLVITQRLPQKEFISLVNRARHTVFLPATEEGFYLPALEGMALETLVICPDVGGNRDFCRANYNCLLPSYQINDIQQTIISALSFSKTQRQLLLENAKVTVQQHALEKERSAFLDILYNLKNIW